jgi:diguanylate cyclase (GGDEF)-like protein
LRARATDGGSAAMHVPSTNHRLGIATKLYCVAALSVAAVAFLVLVSLHFAGVTDSAADRLYHDGFEAIESSARLQALLEQHRRIVESSPAEVDRKRLEASQRAMIEISSQLSALVNELTRRNNGPDADAIEQRIANDIPELIRRGQDVLFYAYNFAQDKALEATVSYAAVADRVQDLIREYRSDRMKTADQAVSRLLESARGLVLWVSAGALAVFVLIGPLGLTITRGVLRRLGRITTSMVRLAHHDTTLAVPSRADRDEVGDMARAVQVFKENAIELLQRKTELEQVNRRLDVAINNMSHGLSMFDASMHLIICNERFRTMYGLTAELVKPGTPLRDILSYLIENGSIKTSLDEALLETSRQADDGIDSYLSELPGGRVIATSHQRMSDGGWVAVHEDVTDRRRAEARIAHLAHHDQLTDLPNRTYFLQELDLAVQGLRRGKKFAVLCLDLDRFKGVNDSLGHPIGDFLLKAAGERLRACIGPNDFVARLGGDEFAVIQSDVDAPEVAGKLAQCLIEAISLPYAIEDHQIVVGVSIGIALAPADGRNPDQLLRNSDIAMYRAKAEGRGAYRLFEQEMDARIQARRALELDMRHALNSGQLQIYYQPLVSATSGSVKGFEALLRWFHPQHGEIAPSEFIPMAEETGLINPLGEWVLRTACSTAVKLPSDTAVAVNLSPVQFRSGNLVHVVLGALAASGLPAHRLEIEITESVLMEDDAKTLATLHQLRQIGVRISMDDFGTGYSSLNYLRSFPFDKIKIDRSFVRDIANSPDGLAIVRAIMSMAESLGISVVAEGVETVEQYQLLRKEGCTELQGFYFSPPQPAEKLFGILAECKKRFRVAA